MFYPLLDEIIKLAILEDIGSGDITTDFVVSDGVLAKASILCKEDMFVAGLPFAKRVFELLMEGKRFSRFEFKEFFKDGDWVKKGYEIAHITSDAKLLLAGERISLNILQRLSGIATVTREFVKKVEELPVKILDTRKTTPGLRFMEKYAVRVGGGFNHRFALYDAILIKDNHIKIAGTIKEAIKRAKNRCIHQKIEVEVNTLSELEEAISAGADIVMLDNMDLDTMREAVRIAKGRVLLEASGGVSLQNVREIALTGVDFISIGALTHSSRAMDISMKIREVL